MPKTGAWDSWSLRENVMLIIYIWQHFWAAPILNFTFRIIYLYGYTLINPTWRSARNTVSSVMISSKETLFWFVFCFVFVNGLRLYFFFLLGGWWLHSPLHFETCEHRKQKHHEKQLHWREKLWSTSLGVRKKVIGWGGWTLMAACREKLYRSVLCKTLCTVNGPIKFASAVPVFIAQIAEIKQELLCSSFSTTLNLRRTGSALVSCVNQN